MELLLAKSATVEIVIKIVFWVVLMPIMWGSLLYARSQAKKRKNIQTEILNAKADLLAQGRCFPIKYSSQAPLRAWLRFWSFPWEDTGILSISESQVIFCRRNLDLKFVLEDSKVKWIGKPFLSANSLFWLEIDFRDEKHYFSADIGAFRFGSKVKTREIYNELTKALGSDPEEIKNIR